MVVIENEEDAVPLANALMNAGLSTMEITFRTPAAQRALALVAQSYPTMLVGAGTVLTVDQAQRAVEGGARYIVSPGLQRAVAEYCTSIGVPLIPGVITPTEISAALELGLEVLKFFPAEASGGVKYLEAVSAPFRSVKFIPTGGIDETNVAAYLRLSSVVACGGSWMVQRQLLSQKRFDEIEKLAGRAVSIVKEVRRQSSMGGR